MLRLVADGGAHMGLVGYPSLAIPLEEVTDQVLEGGGVLLHSRCVMLTVSLGVSGTEYTSSPCSTPTGVISMRSRWMRPTGSKLKLSTKLSIRLSVAALSCSSFLTWVSS